MLLWAWRLETAATVLVGTASAELPAPGSIIEFAAPARAVPSNKMADGPLLGNGDVGVVQAGPPEALAFYIGKNDYWGLGRQAPMPVGQVRILTPALAGGSFKAVEDMRLAEVRGDYAKGPAALASRAWVDANHNLLCVELANKGTETLHISVNTVMGDGDHGGAEGDRRVIGCQTRVVGADAGAGEFTVNPGGTVMVATAILSDLDSKNREPAVKAKAMVDALTPEKIAELSKAHRQWWLDFWSRSFIEIPDKVIEQCWYSSWYIMGSCSRAGKVAPGLWGNWITGDRPAWHGDFHLNYNFEAPFYGLYSANHAESTLPFYDAMNQSIPRGKRIAEKHGWKGIHLPVSIGPWGMCPEGDNSDWGQRSNTVYAALPFIWYWQYTGDRAWLKSTGYDYLRETALFWEDYLKLEPGPDGKERYVIYNDSIHEGSGPDFNPVMSLGMVRTLFKNMIPMSEALGADADKRAKWRDILAKLSDYPTQERNGKNVFRYTEKGMAWNNGNTLGIQHIFPGGAIGLDSEPRLLELSRNTIDAMARWQDSNGSSSWYTACARVAYDPNKILTELRAMYDRHTLPNKLLNFGGGGIENVSPALGVTEMLLQSNDGVIRLFPCWPRQMDARFGTLRAVGAFLVSAEIKGGIIGNVSITSQIGGDCAIMNPWPDKTVRVTRSQTGKSATVTGPRFVLKTGPNETMRLEPVAISAPR